MNFEQLLKFGIDQGASDLHLQSGSPPHLRIGGQIRHVESAPVGADELRAFIASIARPDVAGEVDRAIVEGLAFTTAIGGLARFRASLSSHLGSPSLVLRVLPAAVRSIEQLHLPPVIRDIALSRRGLTLVTGPGGSGRTTTLATMVDQINGASSSKILTIEDPVEYLHPNKKALITQMEVGPDTPSFEHGLGQALRQDPDVIVIGEVRGYEAIRMALRAVAAGRQVLAVTLGTSTTQVIESILAMVPDAERRVVTAQIATSLEAIVTQRMAVTKDGGRRPAVEVLRGGPYTARAITEGLLGDLNNFLSGRQGGMQKFDQHLIEMYHGGLISGTEAMRLAVNPESVAMDLRTPHLPANAELQP